MGVREGPWDHPTQPADPQNPTMPMPEAFDDNTAALLPPKHCGFKHCCWELPWTQGVAIETERHREKKLFEHIKKEHAEIMASAMNLLPGNATSLEKIAACYNEAIAVKTRQGAPIASYSIDRKCLRKASDTLQGNNIQALICSLCACIYPHIEQEAKSEIMWSQPLRKSADGKRTLFFGFDEDVTSQALSVEAYLKKYGKDSKGYMDLHTQQTEFDDWYLSVEFENKHVNILCCPEDRKCTSPTKHGLKSLCFDCQIPVCRDCKGYADRGSLPLRSLANDMMIFYAPEELYEDGGLTIMEMICASPCITSMICFSLEVRYGHLFDSTLHMQQHRVGARGNATTFMLPWESLLSELQRLDAEAQQEAAPDLPRTGKDLKYAVQVLLKTNDEEKRASLKNFIHQAQVNREKVVRCILAMKRRGHRAYVNVREDALRKKALQLPEQGVPPELISLLPNDNSFEKLRMQKAATPVERMKENAKEVRCHSMGAYFNPLDGVFGLLTSLTSHFRHINVINVTCSAY